MHFPVLMAPFPVNIFCNIEAAKVQNNIPRKLPSYLFILCFTVLLNGSINTPAFSRDFMILIISSMTVCYYHATYSIQIKYALHSCLKIKELLARISRDI